MFSNYNHLADRMANKVVVSVTIHPNVLKEVDLICNLNRVSRSYFFGEALKLALEKNREHKNKGYVYLGQLETMNIYKIGHSEDPKRRIEHDFGSKFPFEVQGLMFIETKDMKALEKLLHTYFKDVRKGNTEWFDLKPEHIDWFISKRYETIPEIQELLL